jgi:anti-anti-sigma factor
MHADGRVFPVPPTGLLIGRRADAGVPLDDPEVSRRHAEVLDRDGRLVLVDLGSSNGTLLNGQRVQGEAPLADGDVLQIGRARLTVRLRPARAAARPPASPAPPPPPAPEVAAPPPSPAPAPPPRVPQGTTGGAGALRLGGPAPAGTRLAVQVVEQPARPEGAAVLLRLTGVLDIETVPILSAQTEPLIQRGAVHFVLEATDLEYLDSSGLAALVALKREVGARAGTVELRNLQPAVRGIIELTRLDRLFVLQ